MPFVDLKSFFFMLSRVSIFSLVASGFGDLVRKADTPQDYKNILLYIPQIVHLISFCLFSSLLHLEFIFAQSCS